MQERKRERVCLCAHVCMYLIHEGQTKVMCCLILYPCTGAANKVEHAQVKPPERGTIIHSLIDIYTRI